MSAEALERAFRDELAGGSRATDKQYLPPQLLEPPPAGRTGARGRERPRLAPARARRAARRRSWTGRTRRSSGARAVPQPSADDQADTLFLEGEIALAAPRRRRRRGGVRGDADADAAPRRVRRARAAGAGGDPPQARRRRRGAPATGRRASIPSRVEPHALLAEMLQEPAADRRPAASSSRRRCASTRRPTASPRRWCSGRRKAGRPARVVELAPIAIFIDPGKPRPARARSGAPWPRRARPPPGRRPSNGALPLRPASPRPLHLALATLYDTPRRRQAGGRATAPPPAPAPRGGR